MGSTPIAAQVIETAVLTTLPNIVDLMGTMLIISANDESVGQVMLRSMISIVLVIDNRFVVRLKGKEVHMMEAISI